jgi:hypothetical protein
MDLNCSKSRELLSEDHLVRHSGEQGLDEMAKDAAQTGKRRSSRSQQVSAAIAPQWIWASSPHHKLPVRDDGTDVMPRFSTSGQPCFQHSLRRCRNRDQRGGKAEYRTACMRRRRGICSRKQLRKQ